MAEVRQRKAASQPAGKTLTVVDKEAVRKRLACQIIIVVRLAGAMYATVTADCDEVFNYWEPLHYLLYGEGFQTWEYSPAYAIRSWAYLVLHALPPSLVRLVSPADKRTAFFALRIVFALLSTVIESRLYRAIVEHIGVRVGRYFLFFSLASAGMWNASTAFLPSSFALHLCNLAFSHYIAPRHDDRRRTFVATACFAVAAIVGWPFAALLAVPFALEELFVKGGSVVFSSLSRFSRLLAAGLLGSSVLAPLVLIDSYFYNKIVLVPLNILRYNILESKATLYGTESWHWYVVNSLLNFNIAYLLALLSLPMLGFSHFYDRTRIGPLSAKGETGPTTTLALRLLPFYLWFAVLTLQPHKEERFLFPAYGFLCFDAALTLYLIRGALERFYSDLTGSSAKAAQSSLYTAYTFNIMLLFGALSTARIAAVQTYYRAPENLATYFQYSELPRLAIAADPAAYPQYRHLNVSNLALALEKADRQFDLEPLRDMELRLCWAKEWYRFPGSFLVPDVVEPRLVRSDFTGLVPRPFDERYGTSIAPPGLNDDNKEDLSSYVPLQSCQYVIDGVYPRRARPKASSREQSLSRDPAWRKVICLPLLDNDNSPSINRAIYLPIPGWAEQNAFGDYCLYRAADLP